MKRFIFTFILISITLTLFAQNRFDVFYVGGNYNFMQATAANPEKNNESSIVANLSVPIVFKDSSVWITIVDYQSFSIPNEYFPTDSAPIKNFNLHGFIVRTGYVHKFNSTQSLQVLAMPRYMNDFNASFSKSFQLGGMVMYEKVKSKDFTYRVGLLYNQEFFGPYLMPVLYLDWKITGKLKFTGLLPVYGKLYVQPTEKFSTGLHFVGLTTSYRIYQPGFENYYVERNSIDLSLFSNIMVLKNIFLEGRVGYSLTKDYALFAENQKVDFTIPLVYFGDNRNRANGKYKSSPFVHLRLVYSLPIK
ncbi:MAG: DUF6268 family outer membrane beta-barrel protein [Bacteroidia bacterium]